MAVIPSKDAFSVGSHGNSYFLQLGNLALFRLPYPAVKHLSCQGFRTLTHYPYTAPYLNPLQSSLYACPLLTANSSMPIFSTPSREGGQYGAQGKRSVSPLLCPMTHPDGSTHPEASYHEANPLHTWQSGEYSCDCWWQSVYFPAGRNHILYIYSVVPSCV